ncbi:hypothetical protein D3C80_2058130 [compost metagenome]
MSKLALVGLIVGFESLTVIASVCVAPPLNVNVSVVVPTDCAAKYALLMVIVLPDTV